eukprot:9468339-Pyramimonas_sp.AAC.1
MSMADSLPTSDWSELRVYAPSPHSIGPSCEHMLSPHSIGPSCEHMLSPHIRLVRAASICSLPTFDWSELRAYALSPHSIGASCDHMLRCVKALQGALRTTPPLSTAGHGHCKFDH